MNYQDALWELILSNSGRLPDSFNGSKIIVFTIGCALMGLVAVVLDLTMYSVKNRSVFNLSYGNSFGNISKLICLWGIGAGVGGFFGSGADILQFTRWACIGVGVGWPLILPRIVDSFANEEEQQKPEVK